MKTIYTLAVYLLIGTTFSLACSCLDVSVRKAIKKSEIAFVGKVVNITRNDFVESVIDHSNKVSDFKYSLYDFEFEVTEIFKGELETKTIQIKTTGSDDDCGGYYLKNKSYLIYAYTSNTNPYFGKQTKVSSYLTTDICIGSELIDKIDTKRLKKMKLYKKRNK